MQTTIRHFARRLIEAAVLTAALAAAFAAPGAGRAAEPPPSHEHAVAPHAGETARDPQRLWCAEHEAYEDQCFLCHPELRDKGRLWCNEHGRYEDRCWLCHPELRDASRPYCEKHFLYEDECHLCRPELKKSSQSAPTPAPTVASSAAPQHTNAQGAKGEAHPHEVRTHGDMHSVNGPSAARAAAPADGSAALLWCEEHGVAEAECGICHPELAAELGHGSGVKIRFPSAESADKAGVETARPRIEPIATAVDSVAEITFDGNRLAEVGAPAAGLIERVTAEAGARVQAGDVLATISSAEIAAAVHEAALARQTLERERRLYAQRISAQKDLQAAEAAYRTAQERLRALGFDEERIAAGLADAGKAAALELRAPIAGEIVERSVVKGSRVEAGERLFRIADRSTMWAELSIPEPALASLRVGQRVELTVDGAPERTFEGTLVWIAPGVDERTRMGRGRVELANPGGALRAHTFAHARIAVAHADHAVVVPRSAIQQVENRPFAFVRLAADLYEARPVRLGATTPDLVEVVEGLAPDDDVVVERSFLVKSQLQISRLGAGCTH